MAKEESYQYVLAESEGRLLRHLRELEQEFEAEYLLILNGDPKLFVQSVRKRLCG